MECTGTVVPTTSSMATTPVLGRHRPLKPNRGPITAMEAAQIGEEGVAEAGLEGVVDVAEVGEEAGAGAGVEAKVEVVEEEGEVAMEATFSRGFK